MSYPAPAGVGEPHVLEGHDRREGRGVEKGRGSIAHLGLRLEDLHDAARRGEAQHALMEHHPQLAQRAEHLDAKHEDDEKRAERHLPFAHPPGSEAQGGHLAHRHAGVGDASRERVGSEHAHGAVEEIAPLLSEHARPRPALAEGLQCGQSLDRVEKLRPEGGIRFLARQALAAILAMPE